MSIISSVKSWPKGQKITVAVIAGVSVVAIIAGIALFLNSKYLATTMRLLRVEGTVNIEDSTGSTKPVIDNIRFQSGDALNTGSDGLASVGLDDTKIVTLENDSRAEFYKNNKQLELKLTKGALFFEVTEKLADDETYEIKTSNMSVGIRGTSGYVYYDEDGRESVIITDGVVKVSAYNPETGETKTIEVHGGNKITCYLYSDKTEDHDTIEFDLEEISEDQLPYFPLKMLIENDRLLDKVCEYTGWDKEKLRALFESFYETVKPTPTPEDTEAVTETPTPTDKATPTPTLTPIPTVTLVPSVSTTPKVTPSSTPAAGSTTAPTTTTTPGSSDVTITTPTPKPTSTTAPKGTSYTVTFVTNGKCTAPSAQTVTSGGKATKPANPSASGYTFGGWYKDSACTNAYDFSSAVTSDVTLYAKWTATTTTTPAPTAEPTTAPKTITPPEDLPTDYCSWIVYDTTNDKYVAISRSYPYGGCYVYPDDETGWTYCNVSTEDYGDYGLCWFEYSEGTYFSFKYPNTAPDGYYIRYGSIYSYDMYYVAEEAATGGVYQLYTQNNGWIPGYAETTDNGAKTTFFYLDASGNRVDYWTTDN